MSNRAQIEAYMADDGPESLEWEMVEAELRALWAERDALRKAMRLALEEIDKERWNWVSGALLRGLGDLPPLPDSTE